MAAAVFGVSLVTLLLVPLPESGRQTKALLDLLHAPAFAVLALFGWIVISRRLHGSRIAAAAVVWATAAGLGCASELVQSLVGRNSSWQDALANLLGATAGVIWGFSRTRSGIIARGRLWATVGALIIFASLRPLLTIVDDALQHWQMPMLASFEQPLELSRWTTRDCAVRRVSQHATDGTHSLRIQLQHGTYPGAALRWPVRDWSDFDELSFDVFVEGDPALELIVKVQDDLHDGRAEDRFQRRLQLPPGSTRVHVALADIADAPQDRKLELDRVTLLQFFTIRPKHPRTLYLDNVHLRR